MKLKILFLSLFFLFFSCLFYFYLTGMLEAEYRKYYLKSMNIQTTSPEKGLNTKIFIIFKNSMREIDSLKDMKFLGTAITIPKNSIWHSNYAIIESLNEQELYRKGDTVSTNMVKEKMWYVNSNFLISKIEKNKIELKDYKTNYYGRFCYVNRRLLVDLINFSLKGFFSPYSENGIEGIIINSEPSISHRFLRETGLKKGDILLSIQSKKLQNPEDIVRILLETKSILNINMEVIIGGTPDNFYFTYKKFNKLCSETTELDKFLMYVMGLKLK